MPGRCLEDAKVTLNTAWRAIMPNWQNSIEYCFNWLVPFLSLAMDWPLSALFLDISRVSERSLGGVLGCLSVWGGVGVGGEID